jgi:hypothetical protein
MTDLDELAIACSLGETELPERLRQMAELGRDALLESRTAGTRAELRFAGGPGVRERVDAIVTAESQCCAFLDLQVSAEDGAVVLRVTAPDGAELVLTELVAAFQRDHGSR